MAPFRSVSRQDSVDPKTESNVLWITVADRSISFGAEGDRAQQKENVT